MKKLNHLLAVFTLTILCLNVQAQGFPAPEEGNAVIYLARVTNYGKAASFEFFHNDKFICIFKGMNYMRYEVPAGKHLIWASSEGKEFLNCDLKAGETYLALVNVKMGFWKASLSLEPITTDNEDFERVKELILSKAPVTTSEEKIKSTQKKLEDRGFISNILDRYEKEWINEEVTKKITPEMSIPVDVLK